MFPLSLAAGLVSAEVFEFPCAAEIPGFCEIGLHKHCAVLLIAKNAESVVF